MRDHHITLTRCAPICATACRQALSPRLHNRCPDLECLASALPAALPAALPSLVARAVRGALFCCAWFFSGRGRKGITCGRLASHIFAIPAPCATPHRTPQRTPFAAYAIPLANTKTAANANAQSGGVAIGRGETFGGAQAMKKHTPYRNTPP
jgi:hypothetical protein